MYRKQESSVGCLGNVELKIISYENKSSIISFIIDFNFSDHGKITNKIQQTAGRDALGEFAPEFARLNDDILFGEVWSRNNLLSLRDRSIVTVVALMSQGLTDSSFKYHLESAKKNGVTRTEIAEILTHAAFYAGWPKAWAAFRMAKEVWTDGNADSVAAGSLEAYAQTIISRREDPTMPMPSISSVKVTRLPW